MPESRLSQSARPVADDGLGLARVMARERDQRFEQLKASEAEADRYRIALRKIAGCQNRWLVSSLLRRIVQIAREALDD